MGQHNSKYKNRQPQPYPLANPAFYPHNGAIYPAAYPHFATGPVVPQHHLITPFPFNYYPQQTRRKKKRRRPSARLNTSVAGPSSQPEPQPQAPQVTAAAGVPPPPAVQPVPPVANSVPFTPHMESLANFPRSPLQNPMAVNSRGPTPYPRNPEDDEEEDEEDEEEIVIPSRVRGLRTPAPHRRTRSLPRSGGDVSRSRTPQVEITAPVNPITPWPVSNNPLPQPPRDVTQDSPYRQLANLPEVQSIRRSASAAGASAERERLFRELLANQNPGRIASSQSEALHTQPQPQPSAHHRSRTVASLFGRKNGGGILRTLNPRRRHAHSNSINSDGYVNVQPAEIPRSTTPAEPPPPVMNYTSSVTSADGGPPPPVLNATATPVFAGTRSVTPGVPGVGTTTPGIATPAVGLTQPPQTTAPPPGQLFEPVQSQQSFTYPNTPATQHVYTRPTTPAAPPNLSAPPPIHFSQFSPAPYSGFLNHSPHRVMYQNRTYPTATHLFEALKFLPRHSEFATKISDTPSVPEVYRLSSSWQKHVRPDWGQVFLSMMEEVLMCKFRQHPDLRNVLLATGATDPTREIIYEDERDRFWGRAQDGQGRNVLGNALRTVRERLRVEFG
ncbi:hypothetical protein Moror_8047 [Moniliophthora roreri MCA 2997]|uniref:NADAR domain-containing protein n=2 Tax=Moniliophthora roreri TaxID=221103 RepID=V2YRU7_MONRO|nr:hypothetical protein Moror_8047 [Moniliophthora roreri MCA 2997]KAI3612222.1 hypothetical protein WG66_012225 [Moniliophthora roreri]